MTIRTRFAPSPTGFLHIGGVRTALFAWLQARKLGGEFVLRIEDTDNERSQPEYVTAIVQAMDWLGLDYQGPYFQSERSERYAQVIAQLIAQGKAYYCYCSKEELAIMRERQMAKKLKPRYDGRCRRHVGSPPTGIKPVVRFRNPESGPVAVDDLIHGRVIFQNEELDDLIIARSDSTPTFHLGVVVDDMDMGINYVIRGDDHLNNTPRQINLLRALGAEIPRYAHVPLILNEQGKPLSKREGAANVINYKDQGYLPEALLNYLVRLGWAHGDQEIFSRSELTTLFDISDVHKAGSSINPEKLDWLNQHYIKTLPRAKVVEYLRPIMQARAIDIAHGPDLPTLVETLHERAKTLVELVETSRYFYQDFTQYDAKAAAKNLQQGAEPALAKLKDSFATLANWDKDLIMAVIRQTAEDLTIKMGKVAQPLRVALTGGSASPPIDVTTFLLGPEKVQRRLTQALQYLAKQAHG